MTTNYNRKPISPADAWLCDPDTGAIVGVEYGDSRKQKNFFPGVGNDVADPTFGTATATTFVGALTGNTTGTAASTNSASQGTAATGVVATEYGDGRHHVTVLTVAATLPAIPGGAALGTGKLLYTLPAGAQIIWGSRMSVAITQTEAHITADTPTVGVGTTIASGAVSVLSGTAAFQNINVGKATADCNGTATVQTVAATASPFALVTEAGGTKTIYFNAAATWAASGDAAALLAGTVVLVWDTLA